MQIDPSSLPEGITLEDVTDPGRAQNCTCMSYLETMIPRLFEQMQDCIKREVSPDPKTKQLWRDLKEEKSRLMGGINAGTISEDDYVAGVQAQQAKDKILFQYLMQIGQKQKAAIVSERLKMIEAELGGE